MGAPVQANEARISAILTISELIKWYYCCPSRGILSVFSEAAARRMR